jgi:tripartite-type tricarboxylate transporter receptor subunit TctC
MKRLRWPLFPVLLGVTLLFTSPANGAEKYPSRPIRVVVALGAGGAHDLTARAVASVIPEFLGQPMVVQLMPGGGGKPGMLHVKKAKPDGYTLVLASSSHFTIAPHVRDMGFDPKKDFIPIYKVNNADYMIFSLADKPWKNFDEFVDYARKNPGKVSYGSSGAYGIGHLMILKIMSEKKIQLNHVPFKGGGPAFQAMMGGHVDTAGGNPGTGGAIDHIKRGRIRALAVGGTERYPELPQVPTYRELGVDLLLPSWRIFMAPAGTPKERIEVLVEALKKVSKDKTFQSLLKKMGERNNPLYGSALVKMLDEEYEQYAKIFRSIKVAPKKEK